MPFFHALLYGTSLITEASVEKYPVVSYICLQSVSKRVMIYLQNPYAGFWWFYSASFSTLPEFNTYCHCLPKCKRTEYDVTATSSVLSDYNAIYEYLTTQPPEGLQEIARIKVSISKSIFYSTQGQYFNTQLPD